MKQKIILTLLVLIWLFWTTFAFFWSKSCEDLNADKCFKEINQLKKEYAKEENLALKEQKKWDDIQLEVVKLQALQSGHEEKKAIYELNMTKISEDANSKRNILQQLGF